MKAFHHEHSPQVLGPEPTIHSGARLYHSELGAWTEVGEGSLLEYSTLDDYSYCGPGCIFQNARVGRFANVAALVRIGPTAHPMDRPTQHHFTYRRRMFGLADQDDQEFFRLRREQVSKVGHDTWLGHGAIIMPRVNVGTGAVVGSGAVVTRDVPPYAVVVGSPARVIRYRFPEPVVQALLEIQWWNWSHEQIKEGLEDFSLPIEAFLEKYAHQGRVAAGNGPERKGE